MTFTVLASTAPGSYTVTVTGTGASATHSTTVGLTVTTPGTSPIVNGNFETGNLTGWGTHGTAGVSATSHSGAHAAIVGATTATNGDSSIAQTFTVPASGGTLSFWYNVYCPDDLIYDWATATLHDNVTGTTTTLLARTCNTNNTWVQVTSSLTPNAGHSVTLTLVSHDDDYPADPTYTLYDDVEILGTSPPQPPPSGTVQNPGFETGSFSSWTTTGTSAIVTTSHSGSYAARLGSSSPTNGDSTLSQTFTIPTGATRLSLWYNLYCPDAVRYDWATVTLTDNVTNTTVTMLARTCNTLATWTQISTTVTAGHSVTLKLVSHDDNYPGDATYTLFDDISVQ
jgi:hypothetical protein